jgi:signal transduction histidine kinase
VKKQPAGIVLRCDEFGVVTQIINDTLGIKAFAQPGMPLSRLAATGNLERILSFLDLLRTEGAAFDWEVNIALGETIQPFHLTGSRVGKEILVAGAEDSQFLSRLYDEMIKINNEQTNALRTAAKNQRDASIFDEISRLNNELVAAQRELAKKNAELERLNQEKNRFLGMAAHDLRNPLHNILAASEFLLDEDPSQLGEDYPVFLEAIQESSQFMANLVDDLLDVAKIESGRLDLEYAAHDLKPLLERNIARNQALAAKKNISIRLQSASLPRAVIDAAKLEQVLNNLVGNAVKFSPPGSSIEVRTQMEGANFILAVSDSGPGMTAEEQASLFTEFKRGRAGTQGEKSTGLGLVIVKRIVEGHGGKIWLQSAPGQGSTFFVSIPLLPPGWESEPA